MISYQSLLLSATVLNDNDYHYVITSINSSLMMPKQKCICTKMYVHVYAMTE